MAANTHTNSWLPQRQMRRFMSYATLTLFACLVSVVFLLPLGYMGINAFKSKSQILDENARFWPLTPVGILYEGKTVPLLKVPLENGQEKELALIEPYNDESIFIDPANPTEKITWKGFYRKLQPVMRSKPTYENFPNAWEQINLGILFRNTFVIALLGTLGTLLSSVCVAYGFSRFRIPGSNVIFLVLIATIILPTQVTLIPTYIFFRMIGWSGTWLPLIIPHFFANAYNVFLLRQYFKGIPKEMDESAMIDGANPLQVLISIILPQSVPALIAVGMFHFFWAWNDFFTPLVYLQGKEELYPISVGLTQFNNIYTAQPNLAMAAAMMVIIVPVVIFFSAQRVFMQGIVITGVEK